MNCCSLPGLDVRKIAGKLRAGARLMVGQGDYDAYVAHMRTRHEEVDVLSPSEYFRAREKARYGGSGERAFRCC